MTSSGDPEPFKGFEQPQQNYSKLPHAFINLLPIMQSKSELCVVLYILRHTWGYQEYEDARRISVDEFANGRKKRDGTRIDSGVGMSEPAIRAGIKAAIGHGFILVEVDDSDKARVDKFYKLNMVGENNLPPEREEGGKQFTPNGKKSTPEHRKKLEERNIEKNHSAPNGAVASQPKPRKREPFYDAIADVWETDASGIIVTIRSIMQGTATRRTIKDCNFNPPVTDVEEIYAFRPFMKARMAEKKMTAPPSAYTTIQAWFYDFRKGRVKKQSAPQVVIAPEPVEEVVTPGELAARRALTQSVRPEWEREGI